MTRQIWHEPSLPPERQTENIVNFIIFLNRNYMLADSSKHYMCKLIDKYRKMSDDRISENLVRDFLTERYERYGKRELIRDAPSRKTAITKWLIFKGEEEMVKRLKPFFKTIKTPSPRRAKTFDTDTFFNFVQTCTNEEITILSLMYDTACRRTAAVSLRLNDIMEANGKYFVTLHEKGNKTFQKRINIQTYQKIKYLIRELKIEGKLKKNGRLFYVKFNKEKAGHKFYSDLKNKTKKFQLVPYGISPHWIRAARLQDVYEKYHDILLAQDMAHHASVTTTMKYLGNLSGISSKVIDDEEHSR
jgi:integrase